MQLGDKRKRIPWEQRGSNALKGQGQAFQDEGQVEQVVASVDATVTRLKFKFKHEIQKCLTLTYNASQVTGKASDLQVLKQLPCLGRAYQGCIPRLQELQ